MPPPTPSPVVTDGTLFVLGDYVLFGAALGIVLFTIFYGIRSNWTRTQAGRSLFIDRLMFTLLVLLVTATRFLGPDWPFRGWVRLGIYTAIFYSSWRLLFTLLRIQHRHPDKVNSNDLMDLTEQEAPQPPQERI